MSVDIEKIKQLKELGFGPAEIAAMMGGSKKESVLGEHIDRSIETAKELMNASGSLTKAVAGESTVPAISSEMKTVGLAAAAFAAFSWLT